MGLQSWEIYRIASLVDRAKANRARPRVLSLGHPDVLATPAQLFVLFERELDTRNEQVRNDRRLAGAADIIGDAKILFDALGCDFHVIDGRGTLFGVDEEVDLNQPIADRFKAAYDIVLDCGTTEHCFNVGQAIANAASAVGEGGFVYHMNPMVMLNHAFYNFSPLLYVEFYEANGFEVEFLKANLRGEWLDVDPARKFRFHNDGRKVTICCVAQRRVVKPIVFPFQRKYL